MKFVIFLACVIAFVAAAPPTHEEIETKIKEHHEACQTDPETHLDEEIIEKLKKKEKVDPHVLAKHAKCMLDKAGYLKADGQVDVEKLKKRISERIPDAEKVNKLIDHCTEKQENDDKQVVHFYFCLFRHRHHGDHGHDDSHSHED